MATTQTSRPADGVRQITLDRPDNLNAMTRTMIGELYAALDDIEPDESCRAVVITGNGRAFCAGLDLGGYDDSPDETPDHGAVRNGLATQREIAGLAQRMHHFPKPIIAAVNGAAAGGGLALVLASDIRLAAPSAVFAVSFIRAGFSACDIGTSWLLPRIVGAGRAHELMLTGRRCDADEALRIGLVTEIAEDVVQAALEKAEQIAMNPPFSIELTKQGMWTALETPSFDASVRFENRQQILTSFTDDRAEATASFLEKRKPDYRYR